MEEGKFCWDCLKDKPVNHFSEKYYNGSVCKECKDKYEPLIKKYFFEKNREKRFSSYDNAFITLTDIYFKKKNKVYFVSGYNQKDEVYDVCKGFNFKVQLIKNKFKWFRFYGDKNTPMEFLDYVKSKNYHLQKDNWELKYSKGYNLWDFGGNLEEISSAFSYRIYNKEIKGEIKRFIDKFKIRG